MNNMFGRNGIFSYFIIFMFLIIAVLLFTLKLYFISVFMFAFFIVFLIWSLLTSKYIYLIFGKKKIGYVYDYTYYPFYTYHRHVSYPRTIPQVDIIVYDNGFEKKIYSRDYFDEKLSKYIKDNLELTRSSDSKKLYVDVYFIGKRYYVDFNSIRID